MHSKHLFGLQSHIIRLFDSIIFWWQIHYKLRNVICKIWQNQKTICVFFWFKWLLYFAEWTFATLHSCWSLCRRSWDRDRLQLHRTQAELWVLLWESGGLHQQLCGTAQGRKRLEKADKLNIQIITLCIVYLITLYIIL